MLRRRVVGQHDDRPRAADPAQQRCVGARRLVVARDHQAARVRHPAAHLGQPLVGGLEHPADPLPARVERGPPGLRDLLLGHRRAQRRGDLVARPRAPVHLAGVGQEDHRPHDAVRQRRARTRTRSRRRTLGPVSLRHIGNERNGVRVRPERRSSQREPPPRRVERLADGLAPRQRVAGVVDLVEDDQRAAGLRALPVQRRMRRNLRVRDRDPVEVGARPGPARCCRPGRSRCRSAPPPAPTGTSGAPWA